MLAMLSSPIDAMLAMLSSPIDAMLAMPIDAMLAMLSSPIDAMLAMFSFFFIGLSVDSVELSRTAALCTTPDLQDYTITMYLNQYWTDHRLAFDLASPNRSMTLTGHFASRIWVPDTFLANDKHSYLHDVTEQNKMVRLYGDGRIVYGMRFTTTLACMMDLHYYPLDVQNCTVEIESYGYPKEDVTMQWKNGPSAVDGADRVRMPQFTLEHFEVASTTISLSTGSYQRLSLVFRLRRNVGFFVFQTYLPSILIVMLSWVSFWINHEATSARVALGITTVLTMTTISTGVRSSLPRISYVKAIDIYLVMCFVFVFAALLEYAMVNYTYWGARAKRRRARPRLAASEYSNYSVASQPLPVSSDAACMSPILGLRSRRATAATTAIAASASGASASASAVEDTDDDDGEPPPLLPPPPNEPPPLPVYPLSAHVPCRRRRRQRGPQPRGSRSCSSLPRLADCVCENVGDESPDGDTSARATSISRRRRRQLLLRRLRRRARQFRQRLPRVKDVNKIDKYSRLAFPSLFALFNIHRSVNSCSVVSEFELRTGDAAVVRGGRIWRGRGGCGVGGTAGGGVGSGRGGGGPAVVEEILRIRHGSRAACRLQQRRRGGGSGGGGGGRVGVVASGCVATGESLGGRGSGFSRREPAERHTGCSGGGGPAALRRPPEVTLKLRCGGFISGGGGGGGCESCCSGGGGADGSSCRDFVFHGDVGVVKFVQALPVVVAVPRRLWSAAAGASTTVAADSGAAAVRRMPDAAVVYVALRLAAHLGEVCLQLVECRAMMLVQHPALDHQHDQTSDLCVKRRLMRDSSASHLTGSLPPEAWYSWLAVSSAFASPK
uniref:Gamma-aminobutyric acid receptor subunit beta-like n=1 Tax=Macrostomum lignano TaxID=282301 RepID=A0A1I8IT09_9PLAT